MVKIKFLDTNKIYDKLKMKRFEMPNASYTNRQHLFKTNPRMKKRTFDIIAILSIAIALLILNQFDLLEKSAKFMLIPILAFYYLGQYSERKFQK